MAFFINNKSVSIKTETRILFFLNSAITSFKKDSFFIVSHPAFDVIAYGGSGTSVT